MNHSAQKNETQEDPVDAKEGGEEVEEAKHNEEYAHFSQKLDSEAKSIREAEEDIKDKNDATASAGEQE